MILKRILLTVIIGLISIPIWIKFFLWIIIPKDYVSDGGSDFGYGFFIFLFFVPISVLLTLVITWIYSRNIVQVFIRQIQIAFNKS